MSDVAAKAFKINPAQLAYLVENGKVSGDKLTLSLEWIHASMMVSRTRTGEGEMGAQFDALIAPKVAELPDGIGVVSFSAREILGAGFPVSAVKNLNYWRAYQSAAARVCIGRGFLPRIATKLDEASGTLAVTVSFENGPAVADAIAKLRAAHAKEAAKADADDAAPAADDSDAGTGEE